MLTLALPLGNYHGWGVCGKYLSRELARLEPARLVTPPFDAGTVGDELEFAALQGLYVAPEDVELLREEIAESAVLQAITDHRFLPMAPGLRGRRNVGYTFFENTVLGREAIENARRHFDLVVGGCSWCRDLLRGHGLANAEAIFQGVDRSVFNPHENAKQFFEDRFVVFSGGKLEFRKAQDLVIRAFAVLQQRHDDVVLVNAWVNHWAQSWRTMAASRHIEFVDWSPDHAAAASELLARNGVDLGGVVTLSAKPNTAMARIYKNTDVGLFPNRCEGGTNLALMEYMACGKPAIVSNSSGHRDVANERNAILLNALQPVSVSDGAQVVAVWDEPLLEDVVEKLEWAYQNRGALARIGEAGAHAMEAFTWQDAAARFRALLAG
ncbi:MAG TPA: glycosyltransferase family 4 protein [Burkholderiales bacterium]|nr:glycosyltransferase family 4 protein [Burkholderiales bacterium]